MSLSASRAVLRQSAKFTVRNGRRCESTSAKATEAAKSTASKASEGLSRVTSTAGPVISSAVKGLGNTLGKIGGRTGRLIAFVESTFINIFRLESDAERFRGSNG